MDLVSLVGYFTLFYVLVWILFKLSRGIYITYIVPLFGLGHNWRVEKDEWAIITGSTDGIGLEYAKQMVKRKYNVLLLSRSEEKLQNVKQALKEEFPDCEEIKTLAFDFSKTDYSQVEEVVKKLPKVAVLVNNVGISYDSPEYFHLLETWQLFENLINVNIYACTKMCHLVLPHMVKNKKGVIINLSSLSAISPTPLLAVYAASKAYVDNFTRALEMEYRTKGLVIQSVLPAFVVSNMSKIKRPTLMIPTAKHYVDEALRTVGVEKRTFGYIWHKVQGFVQESLITPILGLEFNSKLAFDELNRLRTRAYKKANKKLL